MNEVAWGTELNTYNFAPIFPRPPAKRNGIEEKEDDEEKKPTEEARRNGVSEYPDGCRGCPTGFCSAEMQNGEQQFWEADLPVSVSR